MSRFAITCRHYAPLPPRLRKSHAYALYDEMRDVLPLRMRFESLFYDSAIFTLPSAMAYIAPILLSFTMPRVF